MSPEHYTKHTIQVTVWCKMCSKFTPHRVDAGRRGPCLVCTSRLEAVPSKKPAQPEPVQGKLF